MDKGLLLEKDKSGRVERKHVVHFPVLDIAAFSLLSFYHFLFIRFLSYTVVTWRTGNFSTWHARSLSLSFSLVPPSTIFQRRERWVGVKTARPDVWLKVPGSVSETLGTRADSGQLLLPFLLLRCVSLRTYVLYELFVASYGR